MVADQQEGYIHHMGFPEVEKDVEKSSAYSGAFADAGRPSEGKLQATLHSQFDSHSALLPANSHVW